MSKVVTLRANRYVLVEVLECGGGDVTFNILRDVGGPDEDLNGREHLDALRRARLTHPGRKLRLLAEIDA